MHRITGTYVDPDANGPGKAGFTEGEPGVRGATVVKADWLNAVQEEICAVITGASIALDPASNTQLFTAVQTLVAAFAQTPAFLNGDYSWGGTHHWSLPAAFGSLLTAGSLSSGSLSLDDGAGGSTVSIGNCANTNPGVVFTGTKPIRSRFLPIVGGAATAGWVAPVLIPGIIFDGTPNTSNIYLKELELAEDAQIVSVYAGLEQNTNATTDMKVQLVYWTVNDGGHGAGSETVVVTLNATTFGAPFVQNVVTSHTVANQNRRYFLKFTSSSPDGISCAVNWVAMDFRDAGPRHPGTAYT